MKLLALVESGVSATLVVPPDQQRWMRLFYSARDDSGQHAITLRACRRLDSPAARRRECGWRAGLRVACSWINTQFNGGVYVDFDHAPQLGRCAELLVMVREGPNARGRLFDPPPGSCPDPVERRPRARVGPPVKPVAVDVMPSEGGPETVFTVAIRSRVRLGKLGDRARSYWASVTGPHKIGCIIEHDGGFGLGRPGELVAARLNPNKAKGGRWCRGRFRGRVHYAEGYACPSVGACSPPRDFPRRRVVVGRFSFRVR